MLRFIFLPVGRLARWVDCLVEEEVGLMMKRSTVRLGLAALLALVLSVVATAATAGRAATKSPIKLMVIAAVATPIQNYPDSPAGAQAAADAINKAGGVKGQQIQILFCNTQTNANVAQGCARQAVEQGVAAVVGHVSTLAPLEDPILVQGNIPDVGNWPTGQVIEYTSPNIFGYAGGSSAAYQSLPFALKKLGKKRFVLVYQDVALVTAKIMKNVAKVAGMAPVGTMVLPGSTTDFAPYAEKLRSFNPDSVMMVNSPGVSGGLMRTATSLGLKPLWVHNAGSIGEAEAQQIGAPSEGMLIASSFPSFRDTGDPGIRAWLAEMKAAGKDDPAFLKPAGLDAWLAVHLIAKVGATMKGDVTNTTLMAALRAAKTKINLYGLVSYAPGAKGPAAYPRWSSLREYYLTVKNGQLVSWGPQLPPIDPMAAQHFVR
jgi:ABC-type branched-subunit amino acid transport system substrate-binding protein